MKDNSESQIGSKKWDPYSYYKNEKVAEEYDRSRFSSPAGRVFDRLEKAALEASFRDLPAGSLILDAPTGTGRLAETLLEMGHRVVGVDISEEMLTVARRKLQRFGERYQTIVSDVRELQFEAASFDAVLCARVLMHFPLNEQIDFLRSVSKFSKGPVVFNQSILTPYHRYRRRLKMLLGNQPPVAFPLQGTDADELMRASNLIESRRHSILPLVSEAIFFVCRKKA